MAKYQPFYYKLINHKIKKITSFILIRLHLQTTTILEMMILTTTEYFTVKSGQEMGHAPVIAMNFMCKKFFLNFSGLSRGWSGLFESATGYVSVDRSYHSQTRSRSKVKNLNVLRVMHRFTGI